MQITDFREQFEPYLKRAIQEKFPLYTEYTSDPTILEFIQYAERIIGGGKCIRPYMSFLVYTALGGTNIPQVMDLLVSLEVFHAFALIHDDVIDRGLMRHKQETIHSYVAKRLQQDQRYSKDYQHDGNAQAILIGDMLFAWSLERFHSFRDLPYHQDAGQIFHRMIDEVVVGQMIDVDVMTRASVDSRLIETKMRLKTAGYTFVRPMQIGAALAGKGSLMEEFCYDFGVALGLAFQTQDDVLDLISDPTVVKKTVLSDIRDHQHTYLTQYVFECGEQADKDALLAVWGTEVSDEQQESIIDIFERTGALDYCQEMIQTYLSRARQICLADTELSEEGRQALEEIIQYIEQRSY